MSDLVPSKADLRTQLSAMQTCGMNRQPDDPAKPPSWRPYRYSGPSGESEFINVDRTPSGWVVAGSDPLDLDATIDRIYRLSSPTLSDAPAPPAPATETNDSPPVPVSGPPDGSGPGNAAEPADPGPAAAAVDRVLLVLVGAGSDGVDFWNLRDRTGLSDASTLDVLDALVLRGQAMARWFFRPSGEASIPAGSPMAAAAGLSGPGLVEAALDEHAPAMTPDRTSKPDPDDQNVAAWTAASQSGEPGGPVSVEAILARASQMAKDILSAERSGHVMPIGFPTMAADLLKWMTRVEQLQDRTDRLDEAVAAVCAAVVRDGGGRVLLRDLYGLPSLRQRYSERQIAAAVGTIARDGPLAMTGLLSGDPAFETRASIRAAAGITPISEPIRVILSTLAHYARSEPIPVETLYEIVRHESVFAASSDELLESMLDDAERIGLVVQTTVPGSGDIRARSRYELTDGGRAAVLASTETVTIGGEIPSVLRTSRPGN